MNNKKIIRVWSISLIVLGVVTIILASTRIMGIELPDMVIRILGVLDLIALAVFGYTTASRFIHKSNRVC